MVDYKDISREFIERTVEIIKQYKRLTEVLPPKREYKVTLLLNSLLGMLLFPKQLIDDRDSQWLSDVFFLSVADEWGLSPSDIRCAGFLNDEKTPVTVGELTMRNFVRQLRNMAAHGRFYVDSAPDGQIRTLAFHQRNRRGGFHLVIPVDRLESFVHKFAESAIKQLETYA